MQIWNNIKCAIDPILINLTHTTPNALKCASVRETLRVSILECNYSNNYFSGDRHRFSESSCIQEICYFPGKICDIDQYAVSYLPHHCSDRIK